MRIKKYVVNSIPDALEKIRVELGQNAIILNTKKIKTGGIFGLFAKQQIEVIAAIDQEKKGTHKPRHTKLGYDVNHSSQTKEFFEQSQENKQQSRVEEQDEASKTDVNQELLHEIKHMKSFMQQMISQHQEKLPPVLQQLNERLMQQEVADEIRTELLSRVMVRLEQDEGSKLNFWEIVQNEFTHYLKAIQCQPHLSKPKIISFIGPTGVGKTTTIAKLAADYILKQKKKVGFITTDTYRIAAVEQLKTYGNILHIPTEVVFSPDELTVALDKLSSCDIILMDTAGRNYLQQMYIEELDKLLPKHDQLQINLVLSLTSKQGDMNHIIQNFKSIHVDCLILTKLDETSSYGMILNLMQKHSFPVTYVTNGQNVPDDILEVTPQMILDLILGEGTHERSS